MPRRARPLSIWISGLNAPGRYALALVTVATSAGGAEILARITHSSRVGGILLVGVLVTSYLVGSGPGYVAAGISFLLYNAFVGRLNPRLDAYSAEDALVLLLFLLVAMLIYGVTSLAWVWLLRSVELGKVYPFMALAFVLVPLGSHFFFGETFSPRYYAGTALVIGGLLLVTLRS